MRHHHLVIVRRILGGVLGLGIIAIVHYTLTKPMAVRFALPLHAIFSMHEFYEDSAPLPDFIHCISAEVTEPEFTSFVTRMKLVPYQGSQSFPSCRIEWWTPSKESSRAFYNPAKREGSIAMAKLENGTLYYVVIDAS